MRESKPEAIEQHRLRLVGADDAAQAKLATGVVSQGEHDIGALDAADLLEDRARAIAEPGAPLPLLERLPQHVGQEADQDVRLNALRLLVPDGAIERSLLWMRKASASVSWTYVRPSSSGAHSETLVRSR